jgi:hypothetical protein
LRTSGMPDGPGGRLFKSLRWQMDRVSKFDALTPRTDVPDEVAVMPAERRLAYAIEFRSFAHGDLAAQLKRGELVESGVRFHAPTNEAKSPTENWSNARS